MKEIQMFPQITEEPEDKIDEEQQLAPIDKESPSPPASSKSSSSLFESVAESPPGKNQTPSNTAPLPKIEVEVSRSDPTGYEAPAQPPRTRMRSLSGGTYRLSPVPAITGRTRRQSGDDVLTDVNRRTGAAFLDAFRPRSKSDTKTKRPTFLSTLKNSIFNSSSNNNSNNANNQKQQRKSSSDQDPLDPLVHEGTGHRQRSKSGSESRGGPMSKMIEMFRSRSNSISVDQRNRKPAITTSRTHNSLSRRYSVGYERRRITSASDPQRSLELPNLGRERPASPSDSSDASAGDVMTSCYFSFRDCYEILPKIVKIVLLDVHLEVEKAFHTLVEHGVRAAPLWDGTKMDFVGFLTITDFIDVLMRHYENPVIGKNLEHHKIQEWKEMAGKADRFIFVEPSNSLTHAVEYLTEHKVHRVAVYDVKTQSVIGHISYWTLLDYFYRKEIKNDDAQEKPPTEYKCLNRSIRSLKIGTYDNIATAEMETPLIDALQIFQERRVSSLPVLHNNRPTVLFSKADILCLANDRAYDDRTLTIGQVFKKLKGQVVEQVMTCTLDFTLKQVMGIMHEQRVHRLVVQKDIDDFTLIGIISVSDVVRFLALRYPGKDLPTISATLGDVIIPERSSEGSASPTSGISESTTAEIHQKEEKSQTESEVLDDDKLVNSQEGDLDELLENAETEVFEDSV